MGSLALIGVSRTSFAADDGIVPVDGATRDRIFQHIRNLPIPGIDGHSVGLDPVGQKIGVTIFAPKGLPTAAFGRLKFGANVTVDVVQAEGPSPHANVAGGESLMPIRPDGRLADCTAGFAVGLKGGLSGFLTAGHCLNADEPVKGQQALAGVEGAPMSGRERVFEPSDWGIFVFDLFPEDRAVPEVVTDNGTLRIQGIAPPRVDMFTCKHGITTKTTCGTVELLDVKVKYRAVKDSSGRVIQPEATVEGLVQTDACNEHGDSGGPVYTTAADGKTMAVGIVSGGVKDDVTERCLETVGKTNISYVVPLSATSVKSTDPSADIFLKVAS